MLEWTVQSYIFPFNSSTLLSKNNAVDDPCLLNGSLVRILTFCQEQIALASAFFSGSAIRYICKTPLQGFCFETFQSGLLRVFPGSERAFGGCLRRIRSKYRLVAVDERGVRSQRCHCLIFLSTGKRCYCIMQCFQVEMLANWSHWRKGH